MFTETLVAAQSGLLRDFKNVLVGETLRKTGPKKGRKERKRSHGKL